MTFDLTRFNPNENPEGEATNIQVFEIVAAPEQPASPEPEEIARLQESLKKLKALAEAIRSGQQVPLIAAQDFRDPMDDLYPRLMKAGLFENCRDPILVGRVLGKEYETYEEWRKQKEIICRHYAPQFWRQMSEDHQKDLLPINSWLYYALECAIKGAGLSMRHPEMLELLGTDLVTFDTVHKPHALFAMKEVYDCNGQLGYMCGLMIGTNTGLTTLEIDCALGLLKNDKNTVDEAPVPLRLG